MLAALCGFTALGGVTLLEDLKSDPASTYETKFTDAGKCLENTPYDPDAGAMVHTDTIDGVNIISVVPKSANSYTPSALFLTIKEHGVFKQPDLQFADAATGSVLDGANCPDQPNGY